LRQLYKIVSSEFQGTEWHANLTDALDVFMAAYNSHFDVRKMYVRCKNEGGCCTLPISDYDDCPYLPFQYRWWIISRCNEGSKVNWQKEGF
jgi:hypothetical protein